MTSLRWDSRRASIILALFVVFLWATSWVLIKIGLEEIPALTFAGLRYSLAFLVLLPVFFLTQGGAVSLGQLSGRILWKLLFLGLLLYSVTQGSQFVALSFLPAVTVNLLWSFSPVAVAFLGLRFLDERPTMFQSAGVLLAISGAVVYFYPASFPGNYQVGIIVSIIGVFANAGAAVLGRDMNRSGDLGPLLVTVVSMGIGSVTLLITGVLFQGLPSIGMRGWAIIAWLAIVNTAFAFTLWNFTLRTLSATESSVINGTMLVWIPMLAVLFLGEHLSVKEILGLIAAGVGTLVVQLRNPATLTQFLGRSRS